MDGIFISYAHADDTPIRDGAQGWVTTFVGHLRQQLKRRTGGRTLTAWMDHALRPQRDVDAELAARIGDSECFLMLISPGYTDSPWCAAEIRTFIEKMGGQAGGRVFIAELLETDRTRWHPATQNLSVLKCWRREQPDTPEVTIGWPLPNPDEDNPYWSLVNKLAALIAEELNREVPEQASEGAPAVAPAPKTPAVWVAEPTDDLADEWQLLVTSLRQQGIEVLPAGDYLRSAKDAWEKGLTGDIERAGLLVQLLGPQAGRQASWSPRSFAQLQAQAAADAARARGLEYLVWRAPDFELNQVKNEDYLKCLQGSRTGSLGEFRQHVMDTWARLAKPAPLVARTSDAPLIYISAEECDQEIGEQVCDMLQELDVDAVLAARPEAKLNPATFRRQLEEQMVSGDGWMIVYGRAPVLWAQTQFSLARKVLPQDGSSVCALLDAPPPEKPKHGIFSRRLKVFDCREGLRLDPLRSFVDDVRGLQRAPAEATA